MSRRKRLKAFRDKQWTVTRAGLSRRYRSWDLEYDISCPEELSLPRTVLHRLLALRTGHGDFTAYHRRFNHDENDCEMQCPHCGMDKTPEHLVFCRFSLRQFNKWPWPCAGEPERPRSTRAKREYLRDLVECPEAFAEFVEATGFFRPPAPAL
jgi:hypothetical protein